MRWRWRGRESEVALARFQFVKQLFWRRLVYPESDVWIMCANHCEQTGKPYPGHVGRYTYKKRRWLAGRMHGLLT
ncbi:hypothetical protein N6P31_09275 [Pectobacterium betavasculorum]